MVGAHLVCALLRQGQSVRATRCKGDLPEYTRHVLSFYTDDYEGQFNEIEWVDADYDDVTSLADAMKDITTVFCCKIPKLKHGHKVDANVLEIKNILTTAQEQHVENFFYLSSYHALGEEPDTKEITELSQRNPKGKYDSFNLAHYRCEMEVQRAMEEGLNASIAAPTVVLGPGNWTTDTSHLFPDSAQRKYYALGVTGFVGVNDVVKCLLTMARKKIYGEKFIVSAQNMGFRALHSLLAQKTGNPEPQKPAPKYVITLYKCCYALKSIFTGRRPVVNSLYINSMTHFRLFDNSKSLRSLIAAYEPIESVIETISTIYKEEQSSGRYKPKKKSMGLTVFL
jgi:nucleoside-diphosphate-sugar epimerase